MSRAPLAFLVAFLSAQSAAAQFGQQGSKLVGSGALGGDSQSMAGYRVALSADGRTALLGGPYDHGWTGKVWVFTLREGAWTEEAMLSSSGPVERPFFGCGIALSADGNTAIVGGPFDNIGGAVGATWVFTRSNGVWVEQARLVGTEAVGGVSEQGYSVAVSADGDTALVGGPEDDDVGAGWVFTRSNGVWTQQAKLVGSGASGHSLQGQSVALSADGNTALIGGSSDSGQTGATWVFARSGEAWVQQGEKLVGTGGVGKPRQGGAVSISEDGTTALVGGWSDDDAHGAAWVFSRSNGVWTQQGSKLVGGGTSPRSRQGESVALSAAGDLAVIGGPAEGPVGGAWVFRRTAGAWGQVGDTLVGSGAIGIAEQGSSVAVSANGDTLLVGGPKDNGKIGAAWVFVRGASGPPVVLLPGVASLGGYNQTRWLSEAVLANPGSSEQSVTVELLPRESGQVAATATRTVPGAGLLRIPDVYADLGVGSGAGMLRVTGGLLTWVRAFNQGASGTFGQDVPPLDPTAGVGAGEVRAFPVTTPTDVATDFRSNLLLVNLEDTEATFTYGVSGHSGGSLHVAPGAYAQVSNVGAALQLPPGVNVLNVTADRRWGATVGLIDPVLGDPTTMRGLALSPPSVALFPGVASLEGYNQTHWRSEAVLYNPSTEGQIALLELIPRGESTVAASGSWGVQPGQVVHLDDLYDVLHAAPGAGLLRVTGRVLTWVRAFNQAGAATFGQDVPQVLPDGGNPPGAPVYFPVVRPADIKREFRSNMLVYNHESAAITCTLSAKGMARTIEVPPGAYVQISDVGSWLGIPAGDATASLTGTGRWSGTVGTIDPFTGDPTTVLGLMAQP